MYRVHACSSSSAAWRLQRYAGERFIYKCHVCLGSYIQILQIRKIEIRVAQNVTGFGLVGKILLAKFQTISGVFTWAALLLLPLWTQKGALGLEIWKSRKKKSSTER